MEARRLAVNPARMFCDELPRNSSSSCCGTLLLALPVLTPFITLYLYLQVLPVLYVIVLLMMVAEQESIKYFAYMSLVILYLRSMCLGTWKSLADTSWFLLFGYQSYIGIRQLLSLTSLLRVSQLLCRTSLDPRMKETSYH